MSELGLSMHAAQVQVLITHLLGLPVSEVSSRQHCNVAWSLAVMGRLDFRMFDALLHQLTTKHKLLLGEHNAKGTSAQSADEDGRQLHQALEWLKPAQGSHQMEAWSSLHSRLQGVAPAPRCIPQYALGHTELCDALVMLRLLYKPMVPFGMYRADAVLFNHDSSTAQVILMLPRSKNLIRNVRSRLLGHVAFRLKMLGRYGTVGTVPYNPDKSNAESMAGAIKAAVEAKTGLPLDSFRR